MTRLDPLAHGIDGLRGALIGVSYFGLAADGAALVLVATMLLLLGSYLFSKIQA